MTIERAGLVLPERAEALDTIHGFNALDPENMTDYRVLAEALGGMSLAVSAVALEYGEAHRPVGVEANVGLWTEIGDEPARLLFATTEQSVFGSVPACIWRRAIKGGQKEYYDSVTIPTNEILDGFLRADPQRLYQGHDLPNSAEVQAIRMRGPSTHTKPQHDAFLPFYKPHALALDGSPSPQESAKSYTHMLQELSKTLLEVAA